MKTTMTVREFDLARGKVDGCCGMEFHHFYGNDLGKYNATTGTYEYPKEKISYEWLIDYLTCPKAKAEKYGLPWFIKPIVLFSCNEKQSKQKGGISPYSFAEWLKAEGETVTESPWALHYAQNIKVFIWNVSDAFYKKLHAAYEAKHGKCSMPSKLSMAVSHHDTM